MPRRPEEEVDWYVEMSDWLERRERRRKWIVLAVCVAVPLGLMGCFMLYIALAEAGVVEKLAGTLRKFRPESTKGVEEPALGPVSLESIQAGEIKFGRLDSEGMITSTTYVFRELLPEGAKVFTVNRKDENSGVVLAFRLRDLGTGEAYPFADMPVKKIGDGWMITDEGWLAIQKELAARKQVRLSKPLFQ